MDCCSVECKYIFVALTRFLLKLCVHAHDLVRCQSSGLVRARVFVVFTRADHLPAPAFNLIGRSYLPACPPPLKSLRDAAGDKIEIRNTKTYNLTSAHICDVAGNGRDIATRLNTA